MLHAQTGADSDQLETQLVYWRCIFCLFESSARMNSQARHVLLINQPPPGQIDGVPTKRLLEKYRIELMELPSITRPPKDYHSAWNTQFITLDAIDLLVELARPDEAVLLLDGDCWFNGSLGEDFESAIDRHGALLYTIDYPPDYPINGLTRAQLLALAREYDPDTPMEEFLYHGGEFICGLGSELRRIASKARIAYQQSLDRHRAGRAKFNEEAHLLSFVYQHLGFAPYTGNRFIKRLWTNRLHSFNVEPGDLSLPIWHLPAEKNNGFVKVFRRLHSENDYSLAGVRGLDYLFRVRASLALLAWVRAWKAGRRLSRLFRRA